MPDQGSFPRRVIGYFKSSIKSGSSCSCRSPTDVFMFSSFLWSSQIVSNVQTNPKVGAFVTWTRIALCSEDEVCKPRSPPHPPFWEVRFPVWYVGNRSDTWKISGQQSRDLIGGFSVASPPRSLVENHSHNCHAQLTETFVHVSFWRVFNLCASYNWCLI